VQPQLLYIDANTGTVRAQTTGTALPSIIALLGTTLVLKAAFTVEGVPGAITDYTADSLRLVVKPADDPDAASSLLPAGTWAAAGSGADVRYTWTGLADSAQLETLLGTQPQITLRAQVEWAISSDSNPRKSLPFDLIIVNSPARLDDGAPDVAGDSAKLWLAAMLAAGGNITLTQDPTSKIITIAASYTLADGSVTTAKLAADAVTTVKILDAAVTAAKLASNAVTTAKIQDAAVTLAKLADLAASTLVGRQSSGTGAPQAVTLGTGLSMSADGILSASTTVADGAITTAKLADLAVTTAKIAAGAIDEAKLGALAVTEGKISAGAVTSDKIAAAAVTLAKLANLAASTLIGRQSSGTGAPQAVTLGTGLNMSADGILSATGGGGSALVRGSGQLLGSTTAHVDATAPAPMIVEFATPSHVMGSASFSWNGSAVDIYFGDSDPMQTYWVDTVSYTTADDLAVGFASMINTIMGALVATNVGNQVVITNGSVGASISVVVSSSFADISYTGGGGAGTNEIMEAGSVSEVTLIAQDGTKTIKPVRVFAYGGGIFDTVQIALKVGSTYYPICQNVGSAEVYEEPIIGAYYAEWVSGRASASLVARISGSTPPFGGDLRVIAIAERY
jgi:hypothetical protein